jgi:MFS family permease
MAGLLKSDDGLLKPQRERMTGYHWWVLIIGCLAWLCDCMGQRIFVLARDWALKDLLNGPIAAALAAEAARQGVDLSNLSAQVVKQITASITTPKGVYATASMMVGWAVGGLFFGIIGDKWGRVRTLSTSIFVYSIFTGLSGISVTWYDFCAWRFLMGCGIGGAFATAATLIAETMPSHVRALALGTFQALSALGNITASAVAWRLIDPGAIFNPLGHPVAGWRLYFFFGVAPAVLIFFIMGTVREPEHWKAAKRTAKDQLDRQMGDLRDMVRTPRWRRNMIIGILLSIAGVVGLWGVGFWTPELIRDAMPAGMPAERVSYVRNLALTVQDVGALLGMFFFTGVALWLGRRASFLICFSLGWVVVSFVFIALRTETQAYWMTPMVGFVTLSVFGGYSIYFPELFPTRLRATGTGMCYNVGRIFAAAVIMFSTPINNFFKGTVSGHQAFFTKLGIVSPFRLGMLTLCLIYFVGIVTLIWAPETKGKPLPTDDDVLG